MSRTIFNRGYSLVEIMVAVAIVAILATVSFRAVDEYRKSARDKERIAELKQLQIALRMYKDSYGRYPAAGCSIAAGTWVSPGPGTATWYASCDAYISSLTPTFMNVLPTDPNETKTNSGYMYRTDATGSEYKIIAHDVVETRVVNAGDTMARCPSSCTQAYCSQRSYAIYSEGAACW